MAKDAYVLRRFSDAGDGKLYPAGAVIEGMDEGRFANLSAIQRVREATAEEVAAARAGEAPAPVDAAPSHPKGLTPPPPPPAPPKRPRRKAAAKNTSASKARKARKGA